MLSACLLLTSALLMPQDAAAPADAPAVSDAVREFLDDVAATLYDPVDQGLESLQFDVPLRAPMGGPEPVNLSTVSVSWGKDREPSFDVTPAADLDPMISQMFAQQGISVDDMSIAMAQQPLMQALNKGFDVEGMLSSNSATLGAGEGLVSVTFVPLPEFAEMVPVKEFTWFFDEDLVPTQKVTKMEQETPMGAMSITITETHTWRAAGADGGLVLQSVETVQDMGMMKLNTRRTSEYATIGDIVMLVGFTESMDGVAGMVPASTTTVDFENVLVNGVGAAPAEEPVVETEPASEG